MDKLLRDGRTLYCSATGIFMAVTSNNWNEEKKVQQQCIEYAGEVMTAVNSYDELKEQSEKDKALIRRLQDENEILRGALRLLKGIYDSECILSQYNDNLIQSLLK